MAFEYTGAGALDYFPCRYGKSKLLFRGPKRRLDGTYCVTVGGTETYGKFVADPFPALLEKDLGTTMVNFGYPNAGIDVFMNDPMILDTCSRAKATVIQLVGAQNMSNRFYAVHPRRNDRFLRASVLMKTLFREMDFTDFHFTRHMLSELRLAAPEKFALIEGELKAAWLARMKFMLAKLGGRAVLLWIGDYHAQAKHGDSLGPDPLFVDADMVAELAPHASAVVRVDPTAAARSAGIADMIYSPFDEPAAAELPGPAIHREIAMALHDPLQALLRH